jgi:uncharacterized protein YciI/thioredoxin-related protein
VETTKQETNEEKIIMIRTILTIAILFTFAQLSLAQNEGKGIPTAAIHKFDPTRDAAKDIRDAVAEATTAHKRIILDIGGEWCIWCRRLDSMFAANQNLSDYLHQQYVVVKVNVSKENENANVLSAYPAVKGYPHLFVLEPDGTLLHSQDTGELESGKHHDPDKVMAFLKKWAPGSPKTEFDMKSGDSLFTMKKYYFCFLKRGPTRNQDSVTVMELQKAHLSHLDKLAADGKISIAGPFDDDGEIRGILIFTVESAEEAERLANNDPAVKAGRLTVEIHPWWGARGSKLP